MGVNPAELFRTCLKVYVFCLDNRTILLIIGMNFTGFSISASPLAAANASDFLHVLAPKCSFFDQPPRTTQKP